MTSAKYWLEIGAVALLLAGCEEGGPAASDETSATDGSGEGSAETSATDEPSGDDESGSEGGDESSGDAPVVCDPPLTKCGQTCVDLQSDPNNCAICGLSCVVPNGDAACIEGVCGLASCDFGWADCDGTITTGCEMLNECDGAQACSTECGSTGALDCADPCAPVCALPVESCNLADDDCDGECDEDAIEGCRVGIHVAYDAVLGQVLMTDADEAQTYGVTIDQMNAFYLYALPGGGTQPVNRCQATSGQFGYSPDNDCEAYGSIESTLAFFSPNDDCGATPLYRMTMPPTAVRLVASDTEMTALVGQGWTVDPTWTGYAWMTP